MRAAHTCVSPAVIAVAAAGRPGTATGRWRSLTNREIGETLFVTPKTVAMHPSNAYRKLGVTSRRDLPHALAEDGRSGS